MKNAGSAGENVEGPEEVYIKDGEYLQVIMVNEDERMVSEFIIPRILRAGGHFAIFLFSGKKYENFPTMFRTGLVPSVFRLSVYTGPSSRMRTRAKLSRFI